MTDRTLSPQQPDPDGAPADATEPVAESDVESVRAVSRAAAAVQDELAKVIVGQKRAIEEVMLAILCRGHCLVQGAPGLAKTLMVSTFARATSLDFGRIQFTPDLMPSDVTGTEILQEDPATGRRRFEFQRGPVFTHVLLADEINRAPPKTQAALLQAMQERQVTAGGRTLDLPDPFFVLATQNPIEQEGTYPLPEAQLDRFLFMVTVGYPQREEELEVLKRTTGSEDSTVRAVLDAGQILQAQRIVRRVPVGEHVYQFALDLVRSTRPDEPDSTDFIRRWLSWGAGPRAGQSLVLAAKARALLRGRIHVLIEDVEAVAAPVLRHRLVPSFNAQAEGVSVEQIVERLLRLVPRGEGRLL